MKKHYVSYVGKKSEGTIFAGGKVYDEIEVHVSCFGSSIVDRLAMTVYEDKKGEFFDFSKTRYKKELGKFYIDKEVK